MDLPKRRHKYGRCHNNLMSSSTKKFLQKICYKETASVDMTQYGFMSYSKVFNVKVVVKPQIENNNCGNNSLQTKKHEKDNTKKQRSSKKKKICTIK